jgi:hypothetical protein
MFTDVSEVGDASKFRKKFTLIMQGVCSSETLVTTTRGHG